MSDLGHVQQTNSLDYGLAWRCGCSICICWSFEVFTITYVHAHPPPPPPLWLVKLYWLCPWLEIIYAKSRVVGYWIYSEEKLLGTPGAFSLLDIHVGSIMVTTFDPHMIWALHWEYSMITPSKGQLFFLIKFYMGTLWVQMYNTLVVLLFVEVSHLPILCPFVLFRILLLFYTQCTVS